MDRIILLMLFSGVLQAQQIDTIINMGIYKSYFNLELKEPVAVVYKLYKGGGKASRENDKFKATRLTLCDEDYKNSGYDRGHLAAAEDFAFSDSLQALTFSYYNCVPQLPHMNRGSWHKYENTARKLSQADTITVVCINEFTPPYSKLNVPSCYKIVFAKKQIAFTVGFSASGNAIEVPAAIIQKGELLFRQ